MLSHRNSLILFDLFEFEQNVRNTAMLYIHNIQSGDKTKGDFSLLYLIGNEKDSKTSSGHRCGPKRVSS